jgi:hypothetical protein
MQLQLHNLLNASQPFTPSQTVAFCCRTRVHPSYHFSPVSVVGPLFSVLSYELNSPPVCTIKFVIYTVDLVDCCKQILAIYLAIASPLCPGG